MGHGFGLDMSTMAEIMVGASSSNILTGLECVGPLKVKDTVSQSRLDISSGSLKVPNGAGLALSYSHHYIPSASNTNKALESCR
jgi:muconate cycloisomerase